MEPEAQTIRILWCSPDAFYTEISTLKVRKLLAAPKEKRKRENKKRRKTVYKISESEPSEREAHTAPCRVKLVHNISKWNLGKIHVSERRWVSYGFVVVLLGLKKSFLLKIWWKKVILGKIRVLDFQKSRFLVKIWSIFAQNIQKIEFSRKSSMLVLNQTVFGTF